MPRAYGKGLRTCARSALLAGLCALLAACGLDTTGDGDAPDDASPIGARDSGANADAKGDVNVPNVTAAGRSLVAGASVAESSHYKAIVTLGQGPGDQTSASSPHFRFVGGVVSATQKP